jgi:predicted nucleotidyltransferase
MMSATIQLNTSPNISRDLNKATEILSRHGATKVILYGSFARGDFTDYSDIDLCADGLVGVKYFRAIGECLRDIETPVSIVPLANTWGVFRERILSEGRVIYERRV